jgi:hypothetical protein
MCSSPWVRAVFLSCFFLFLSVSIYPYTCLRICAVQVVCAARAKYAIFKWTRDLEAEVAADESFKSRTGKSKGYLSP